MESDNPRTQRLGSEGYVFKPGGFFRDAGGGGWAGIRMAFNKHISDVEERRKEVVRDENGRNLESDCDMHLAKNLGALCKVVTKKTCIDPGFGLWIDPRKTTTTNAHIFFH